MKHRILSTLAALAAVFLSGCEKKDVSRYTKDGLFKLRIATPTGYSMNQIADSLGFWKQEGIQPEYIGVLVVGTAVPAALSGKVDVVGGHPNTIIKARLAGAKITMVANSIVDDSANPHIVYHVRKASGLGTPQSFVELAKTRKIKIAVSARNGCQDWYFDEWLSAAGVKEDQLDWQIMPQQQQLGALSQGLVDVITSHPPFIKTGDADTNFHRVLSSFDIVKNPAAGSSYIGFPDKFIKQYPKIVEAFVRVNNRANRWSNEHQDSARFLFAKLFKQKPENTSVFTFNPRAWIHDSDINPWIVRQIAHRDIKPDTKIKASDIYTNEFSDEWKKAGRPNTFVALATKP